MTGFGGARSRPKMRHGFARHGGSEGTQGWRPSGRAQADRASGRRARARPARDRHGSARRARESQGALAARGAFVRPERARGARTMRHGRSRSGARLARPPMADARARRGPAHVRRPGRSRQQTSRRASSDPPAALARPGDRSGRRARQSGPSRGSGHADRAGASSSRSRSRCAAATPHLLGRRLPAPGPRRIVRASTSSAPKSSEPSSRSRFRRHGSSRGARNDRSCWRKSRRCSLRST